MCILVVLHTLDVLASPISEFNARALVNHRFSHLTGPYPAQESLFVHTQHAGNLASRVKFLHCLYYRHIRPSVVNFDLQEFIALVGRRELEG
jgi:hypothetical protein